MKETIIKSACKGNAVLKTEGSSEPFDAVRDAERLYKFFNEEIPWKTVREFLRIARERGLGE